MQSWLHQYLTRAFPLVLETRAELAEGEFVGYANVFGVVDAYGTSFDPGSFANTLRENPQPVLLWMHHREEPIGLVTTAVEDQTGLRIHGQLNLEVARAREIHSLIRQGAVRGLSVGFVPVREVWDSARQQARFTEVVLREVSAVTFPANTEARIGTVRAAQDAMCPGADPALPDPAEVWVVQQLLQAWRYEQRRMIR